MKIEQIREIAKGHGIKGAKLKKAELIREIQRAEGNFDCFGSERAVACDESDCLWREDCVD